VSGTRHATMRCSGQTPLWTRAVGLRLFLFRRSQILLRLFLFRRSQLLSLSLAPTHPTVPPSPFPRVGPGGGRSSTADVISESADQQVRMNGSTAAYGSRGCAASHSLARCWASAIWGKPSNRTAYTNSCSAASRYQGTVSVLLLEGGRGDNAGGEVSPDAASQRRLSRPLVDGGTADLRRVALCGTFRVTAALS